MLSLLLFLGKVAMPAKFHEKWTNSESVHFSLPIKGNPYDAESNDVRVVFRDGVIREERIAFFTGSDWECYFRGHKPGHYSAEVLLNGNAIKKIPNGVTLTSSMKEPFVRVQHGKPYFELSDGRSFWPIGHDMAWQNAGDPLTLTNQIKVMAENGLNWVRIWATYWDGRNPYWNAPKGQLDQKALGKWDQLVKTAEGTGMRIQFTIFHHGPISSTVDSNWKDNPWNVANGGFLQNPEEFFTHPTAIRYSKNYIRYIVARYSYEPAIFGWELFNEVQWSDAAENKHWKVVENWHTMMANYIRSLDSYHHPITSSSDAPPEVWKSLDYLNPHGYPASVSAMILSDPPRGVRPMFYAEIGPAGDGGGAEFQVEAVRDGIWSSILAGDGGSGMYWNWDRMEQDHLYPEYKFATDFLRKVNFVDHIELKPFNSNVTTSAKGDLNVLPGKGWANGTRTSFQLPEDVQNHATMSIPTFFQGKGHADMNTGPLTFSFNAPISGNFETTLATVAKSGADLKIYLNGALVKDLNFDSTDKDRAPAQLISIPYQPGQNVLKMENTGPDWVVLSKYIFTGLGKGINCSAAGSADFAILRLEGSQSSLGSEFHLGGLPLSDGTYTVTFGKLIEKETKVLELRVVGGQLMKSLTLTSPDEIIVLHGH